MVVVCRKILLTVTNRVSVIRYKSAVNHFHFVPVIATAMSQEQKIDYEIMQSLNCLLEFELQDSLQEKDFQTYKGKSKEVLSKLLVKLEDNAEYRKYLESEIKKLEELEKETQLQMAANEAREAERTKQVSFIYYAFEQHCE